MQANSKISSKQVIHYKMKKRMRIVGKLLWYKGSKASGDMLLKEKNQPLGGNSNSYNSMPCHVFSVYLLYPLLTVGGVFVPIL